jgi:hypothetical protein
MANIYVRSTTGNNSNNGTTWALAKLNVAGADAIDAAGDNIWLSQVHAEVAAASYSFAGTTSAPTRLVCGNDGAAPPTALATTAVLASTAGANWFIYGNVYAYGIKFKCGDGTGTGASFVTCGTAGNVQVYESCEIWANNSAAGSVIEIGNVVLNTLTIWRNTNIRFGATGQQLYIAGPFRWTGGAMVAGSSTPTTLFGTYYQANIGGGKIQVENVDFSAFAATMNLTVPPPMQYIVTFRNCKLPSSWTGTVISTAFTAPGRVELFDCDSGNTNYKVWIEDYLGTVKDETTYVRSGGANDGVTGLSWKMAANANVGYPLRGLEGPSEIAIWNDTTGSSKTVTIEIIRDSVTNLKNSEFWIEVCELGTSGNPLGVLASSMCDMVTTPADLTSSSATWAAGLVNPNKQKASVTFTPQHKGFFLVRVVLAKNTTVYVDPLPTVT